MNWESAVIMGLCALNFVTLMALVLVLWRAKLWRLDALLNRQFSPVTVIGSPADAKAWAAAGRMTPQKPADNGSVILMTSERDERLLEGQDD